MSIYFFGCLVLLTMFSSYSFAAITISSPLSISQTLSSPDESFELGFFSPNSSRHRYVGIWFKRVTPLVYVWVANRENPITTLTANLTINNNGSLILLDEKQNIVWSSGGEVNTSNNKRTRAELLNTGNLVIIDNINGTIIWQSFEHLTDTMLPLSSLMYDIPNNKKRVLTSWKSNIDPSPGEFIGELTTDIPPQAIVRRVSPSLPYWRSGPWAETKFTGIPETDRTYVSPFIMVQDLVNGTGSLTFRALRNFDVSTIKLTSNGSLRIHRSSGGTNGWILLFEGPIISCDIYGTCGPYGLCMGSISNPTCKCLKGFVPKSTNEWKSGNWTRGCMRRTELSSGSSTTTTDEFYEVGNMKTPDSYELTSFGDEEKCYQGCLGNCSCLAFAYINGIGCLVWNHELLDMVQFTQGGGETVFIRIARFELDRSKRIKIIAPVSLCVFMVLVLVAFMCWRYRAKQNGEKARVTMEMPEDSWMSKLSPQGVSGLSFFEMHNIQTATGNFSVSNKLGQGGFGTVYKGKLEDGKEIAIKRLSNSSREGTEEFVNEVKLISKLQHRNLVRLLGYCFEGEEKLLIYEFMVNRSLDTFLFDSKKKVEIDWPKRYDIIQGIARGILYLHCDSFLRVVHRDIKASNILLDEKMNPKISDFGLARMFQGVQNQDNTSRVFGTLGYMSPEYAWTGTFSEKSDIYSYGVLILEIVTGKEISKFRYGKDNKNLLAYAWESWSETGGLDMLDDDSVYFDSLEVVKRSVQIGLLCVQHQAVDRPNIKQVMSMLTSTMDIPKPKQPTFIFDSTSDEDGSLSLMSNVHKDWCYDDEEKQIIH